ncbi:hypothetical protein CcaverHIS002_0208290 [Cutaneotrichosporon cavernicola]|uniref:Uncharacterized protein n=1 Tax=Cutaneotrichosporon cavernicola TaxID=279322 RepID=A0AA48L2L8_9TREE|nr:uncharacterized protein CcaverHIS019_0208300 [Cutaneotrichosporon cavernicola]BEI81669.1 hypothetical protein CcaverHIS002_0208290 [Cutaneotrichosporon cavernicola]BEI89468.1 hypothetical protein CcaverHIS019_0208300 [Cutaneotrichosporon cavernicola]
MILMRHQSSFAHHSTIQLHSPRKLFSCTVSPHTFVRVLDPDTLTPVTLIRSSRKIGHLHLSTTPFPPCVFAARVFTRDSPFYSHSPLFSILKID